MNELTRVADRTGSTASRVVWALKAPLAVFVAVAAVGAFTIGNYLVWTDTLQIGEHTKIATTADGVQRAWTHVSELNFYRPVHILSNSVDWALWKNHWFGFHLTNVLLHASCAVLLYEIGRHILARLGVSRAELIAALAAILWGIHPTKVESVAWIAGRTDLLQCLSLGAVVLSLRLIERAARSPSFEPPWRSYVAIGGLFALGLLSKETAIIMPALLLWTHVAARDGSTFRRIGSRLYGMWWGLALLYLGIRLIWLWRPVGFEVEYSLQTRLLTQSAVTFDHLRSLVSPSSASASDVVRLHHDLDWVAGLSLLAIAFVAGAAVVLFRRRIGVVYVWGIGWFAIALAPVSNVFQQAHFRSDRYLYLASFGVILVFVYGVFRVAHHIRSRTVRRSVVCVFFAAILLLFGAANIERAAQWQDDEAFFTGEVDRHPNYREGLNRLCTARMKRADYAGALRLCRRALDVDRTQFATAVRFDWPIYRKMFIALEHAGTIEQAEALAEEAIERHPSHPVYYEVLANVLRASGRHADARAAIDTARSLMAGGQ